MAAVTQSDLDALDLAIATGAREVRFQDRTVVYNSTSDMLTARAHIYNLLNPNPIRITQIYTTKGV